MLRKSAPVKSHTALLPLVALTTLLSAVLLFMVQPMIARFVLPWYGGSAAVWTTCMLFFQLVLVLGYLYGDLLARRVAPSRQLTVHALLIGVAAAALLFSGAHIKPDVALQARGPAQPIANILLVLLFSVGLPYFVVSTTGPLLQAWVAQAAPDTRFYRLYALSNIGSLLALIAFPTVVEPLATNAQQSRGWAIGFLVFGALVLAITVLLRNRAAPASSPSAEAIAEPAAADPAERAAGRLTWLHWASFAALGSLMLLAVTAHIGRNVAAVPFLWVLPLGIYLLSFVLCFDSQRWYRRKVYAPAVIIVSIAMIIGLDAYLGGGLRPTLGIMPLRQALLLYSVGLFVICMFCHGELAAMKPSRAPTAFYLAVACGGAMGGLIGAVLAPLLLPAMFELPIALLIAQLIVAPRLASAWGKRVSALLVGISLVLVALHIKIVHSGALLLSRNFYGALTVNDVKRRDGVSWRTLNHGVIVHGAQRPDEPTRTTTYYALSSGVARALQSIRASRGRPLKIGVVGLGAGVLAAYGGPGDQMKFYELDPQVLDVARHHFTFLEDSPATIEHRLGDARLSMAREAPQNFDLLVLDAFSGDAVPVHLLTREALQVYRTNLAPDGAILAHISNRYIDLRPAIHALAVDGGLNASLAIDDARGNPDATENHWAWLAAQAKPGNDVGFLPLDPQSLGFSARRVWTDDYSDLFGALR